jgi:hypothetical protein
MYCLAVRSKVNVKIVDGLVISHFSVKITMMDIAVTRLEEIIARIIANRDM